MRNFNLRRAKGYDSTHSTYGNIMDSYPKVSSLTFPLCAQLFPYPKPKKQLPITYGIPVCEYISHKYIFFMIFVLQIKVIECVLQFSIHQPMDYTALSYDTFSRNLTL